MSKQYKGQEYKEYSGSLKGSPVANIGDHEILTIKCRSCQAMLFQMQHNLGDGIVTKINTETFRFKAYCSECIAALTNELTK